MARNKGEKAPQATETKLVIGGKKKEAKPRKPAAERNKLNDLTGTEWIRFTRSWFVCNPPCRRSDQITHPAKFPEQMVEDFITYFTKKGQMVLDPFMGIGSSMLASLNRGRKGVGIELNPNYFQLAQKHVNKEQNPENKDILLINDSAASCGDIFAKYALPKVDFIITSPPYWNMLSKSRGNVLSVHKERQAKGLDTVYSQTDSKDLGNIEDYQEFLTVLAHTLRICAANLKLKGYMVVILQNLRSSQGEMVPLAWDLTGKIREYMVFKGEKIWCQDNKRLGIWGYPSEYVSNVHHHYCLVFKKCTDF